MAAVSLFSESQGIDFNQEICYLHSELQHESLMREIHSDIYYIQFCVPSIYFELPFNVPISCLGILHICNLWILVIYFVGRKFYLRVFFCC